MFIDCNFSKASDHYAYNIFETEKRNSCRQSEFFSRQFVECGVKIKKKGLYFGTEGLGQSDVSIHQVNLIIVLQGIMVTWRDRGLKSKIVLPKMKRLKSYQKPLYMIFC